MCVKTPATEQVIANQFPDSTRALFDINSFGPDKTCGSCLCCFTVQPPGLQAARTGQVLMIWGLGLFIPGWDKPCKDDHLTSQPLTPTLTLGSEILISLKSMTETAYLKYH